MSRRMSTTEPRRPRRLDCLAARFPCCPECGSQNPGATHVVLVEVVRCPHCQAAYRVIFHPWDGTFTSLSIKAQRIKDR
jgi:DNA-directed RNA polymerase subunit RPC12/RpoP